MSCASRRSQFHQRTPLGRPLRPPPCQPPLWSTGRRRAATRTRCRRPRRVPAQVRPEGHRDCSHPVEVGGQSGRRKQGPHPCPSTSNAGSVSTTRGRINCHPCAPCRNTSPHRWRIERGKDKGVVTAASRSRERGRRHTPNEVGVRTSSHSASSACRSLSSRPLRFPTFRASAKRVKPYDHSKTRSRAPPSLCRGQIPLYGGQYTPRLPGLILDGRVGVALDPEKAWLYFDHREKTM